MSAGNGQPSKRYFEFRMLTWTPEELERERHARELGQSWCSACWSDHAPDEACVPRVEPDQTSRRYDP